MEGHQLADGPARREQRLQPAIREQPLDEVSLRSPPTIAQPPFLFDGKVRTPPDQRLGEEPVAVARGAAALLGSTRAPAPCRRSSQSFLRTKPAQRGPGRRGRGARGSATVRVVGARLRHHHSDLVAAADESEGVPAPEPLPPQAEGHPLHVGAEGPDQEGVGLAASVPAHALAEQAGGDANRRIGASPSTGTANGTPGETVGSEHNLNEAPLQPPKCPPRPHNLKRMPNERRVMARWRQAAAPAAAGHRMASARHAGRPCGAGVAGFLHARNRRMVARARWPTGSTSWAAPAPSVVAGFGGDDGGSNPDPRIHTWSQLRQTSWSVRSASLD